MASSWVPRSAGAHVTSTESSVPREHTGAGGGSDGGPFVRSASDGWLYRPSPMALTAATLHT